MTGPRIAIVEIPAGMFTLADLERKLRAVARGEERVGGPIATAPKDGRWIWLKTASGVRLPAYWDGVIGRFAAPDDGRRDTVTHWESMTAAEAGRYERVFGRVGSNTAGTAESGRKEPLDSVGRDGEPAVVTGNAGAGQLDAPDFSGSAADLVDGLPSAFRGFLTRKITQALNIAYWRGRIGGKAGTVSTAYARKRAMEAAGEGNAEGRAEERERCLALIETVYEAAAVTVFDRTPELMRLRALYHDVKSGAVVEKGGV